MAGFREYHAGVRQLGWQDATASACMSFREAAGAGRARAGPARQHHSVQAQQAQQPCSLRSTPRAAAHHDCQRAARAQQPVGLFEDGGRCGGRQLVADLQAQVAEGQHGEGQHAASGTEDAGQPLLTTVTGHFFDDGDRAAGHQDG